MNIKYIFFCFLSLSVEVNFLSSMVDQNTSSYIDFNQDQMLFLGSFAEALGLNDFSETSFNNFFSYTIEHLPVLDDNAYMLLLHSLAVSNKEALADLFIKKPIFFELLLIVVLKFIVVKVAQVDRQEFLSGKMQYIRDGSLEDVSLQFIIESIAQFLTLNADFEKKEAFMQQVNSIFLEQINMPILKKHLIILLLKCRKKNKAASFFWTIKMLIDQEMPGIKAFGYLKCGDLIKKIKKSLKCDELNDVKTYIDSLNLAIQNISWYTMGADCVGFGIQDWLSYETLMPFFLALLTNTSYEGNLPGIGYVNIR